jgi:DNA helicase-2/ATP-dependent DNA helicase PcrA
MVEENDDFVPFENIFHSYLKYQVEHNHIDFNDMIYMALRLLIDDDVLRNQLQNRFRYVLVDEFQDLNKAQLLMMQIIALPQNNLFIVGDDDQMIYGWRGAEIKHLLEFNKRYEIVKDCPLSTNYRSSKKIVKHSKWLISHNKERIHKDINPKKDANMGLIEIELKETLWEQAKTVVNWIEQLKSKENMKWSDFAILYRYHAFQFLVAMALDGKDIPHSPVSGQRLFSSRVGKDLYSYLTIILRTDDACKDDYSRILNRPNKYFRNDIINRISSWDSFIRAEHQPDLRNWEGEKLSNFINTIKQLKQVIDSSTSPSSMLNKLNTELDLIGFYKDQSRQFSDLDEASDDIIFEVIQSLSHNFKSIDNFYEYMHKCLFDADTSIEDYDEYKPRDEVKLSTIHAAKGKEFDNVVYFNLSANDKLKANIDIEEERRVAYVGVTRAMNNMLITSLKDKPSEFLKEVAFNPKLQQHSTNALQSLLNEKKREKSKLDYKIKVRNIEIESIKNKSPELEGKGMVGSYRLLNNLRMRLREKRIDRVSKRIDNFESEVKNLKECIIPIEDEINEVNTEINFRKIIQ